MLHPTSLFRNFIALPALLVVLGGIVKVQGDTFFVDLSADGAGTGTSWRDAFSTLQDGLFERKEGDVIYVAEGTYYPDEAKVAPVVDNDRSSSFQLKSGVEIYGGFPRGGGDPSKRDPGRYRVTLSGDLQQDDATNPSGSVNNAYRVVIGSFTKGNTILDGFYITGGNADSVNGAFSGGGMFNDQGELTIRNCTFTGNNARANGGAIANRFASPVIEDCRFFCNTANSGGAISNERESGMDLSLIHI